MKRPFAVIGFTMLITFLIITNITHKMTIALLIGAVVIFCCLLIFKRLRKYQLLIFSLAGVILFTTLFVSAEKYYVKESEGIKNNQVLTGIVCETPKDSDYAHTYVIKVDDKNYKVRFSSNDDYYIEEGDCVRLNVSEISETETEFLPDALSSKIYFIIFEGEKCTIERTGETNLYYKHIGDAKRWFSEIIMQYLPGENGAIARAMTIGDKTEIEQNFIEWSNYCGTSHLLVISGLHLTVWSFGIMRFLDKFSKLRKYSPIIGLLCLLGYSAITGFTVSVIRAGMMIGMVLIGRLFGRDADSINSIGGAVTFILLKNPFAPYSVSLWFSVLSTLGILVYSGKIRSWLHRKVKSEETVKFPVKDTLLNTLSICFSTTIFTLPVFIVNFQIIPITSFLANFIMVNVAMVLMFLTVAGVFSHLLFLYPVSRICFLIVGFCGKILYFFAEKIGLATWSTISINHKYYRIFFVALVIGVIIMFCLKKHNIDILKPLSVVFSVVFLITAVYCVSYEYNTPSVELLITDSFPVMVVTSKNKSVLVGVQSKKYHTAIKEIINKHNEKQLDGIFVTEINGKTIAEVAYLQYDFGRSKIYFYDDCPTVFAETSTGNIDNLTISGNVNISAIQPDCVEISTVGRCILVADCKNIENTYENAKKYDIIIIYGNDSAECESSLQAICETTQIIVAYEGESLSLSL